MYTAVVLNKESRQRLVRRFVHLIPPEWNIVAHHMTINMGPLVKGPAEPTLLGQDVELTVVSVAADDKVMAVGIVSDVPSKNDKKHITLAVNSARGGKPFLSNKLENWEALADPFNLYGTVQEV